LWRYHLYDWPQSPLTAVLQNETSNISTDFGWSAEPVLGAAAWSAERRPLETAVFSQTVQLLGVEASPFTPDQPLEMLTYWRLQAETERPLKIFVHLLNGRGEVVAQHDGLDIRLPGLQPGAEFAQLHTIPWPPALPPGSYALQVGIYDAETGERLPLDAVPSDHILLWTFAVD
jgi:hypothetical protein